MSERVSRDQRQLYCSFTAALLQLYCSERVSKRRDRGAKDIIKRGRRDEMLVHIFERIAVAVIQIPCFRQTVSF